MAWEPRATSPSTLNLHARTLMILRFSKKELPLERREPLIDSEASNPAKKSSHRVSGP